MKKRLGILSITFILLTIIISLCPTINSIEAEEEISLSIFMDLKSRSYEPAAIGFRPRTENRTQNFLFQGDEITYRVLVYAPKGIETIKYFDTISPCFHNETLEAGEKIDSSFRVIVNNQTLTTVPEENVMAIYLCSIAPETIDSMYGEYWVETEVEDSYGISSSTLEEEYIFINPLIVIEVSGEAEFKINGSNYLYSNPMILINVPDGGSGVESKFYIENLENDPNYNKEAYLGANAAGISGLEYMASIGDYNSGWTEFPEKGYLKCLAENQTNNECISIPENSIITMQFRINKTINLTELNLSEHGALFRSIIFDSLENTGAFSGPIEYSSQIIDNPNPEFEIVDKKIFGPENYEIQRITNYLFENETIYYKIKLISQTAGQIGGAGFYLGEDKISDCIYTREYGDNWKNYECNYTVGGPESIYERYALSIIPYGRYPADQGIVFKDYWFFNPVVRVGISSQDFHLGSSYSNKTLYSKSLLIRNNFDYWSSIQLKFDISAQNLAANDSGGCFETGLLNSSNLNYYAVIGEYSSANSINSNGYGYTPISANYENNEWQPILDPGLYLNPGAEFNINFNIEIPENCSPDFYNGSIYLKASASEDNYIIYPIDLSLNILKEEFPAGFCGGTTRCECGDTLVESQTMNYDLVGCSKDGIIIGADNISLDCAGHLISGSSKGLHPADEGYIETGFGIITAKNSDKIKNCIVQEFDVGISSEYNFGIVLLNNLLKNNSWYGIMLSPSNKGEIVNNTCKYNKVNGIMANGAFDNLLLGNRLFENSQNIVLRKSYNNQIINNNVSKSNSNGHDDIGINLLWSFYNNLSRNTIERNEVGILISACQYNQVTENTIESNDFGIMMDIGDSSISWNNLFWNNSFNNTQNIYVEYESPVQKNYWNLSNIGNYWSDFKSNPGYPYFYRIYGEWGFEYGTDWHPLNIIDSDEDGINDNVDNCPEIYNPEQTNSDIDNYGDACDNCPHSENPDQEDGDGDGIGWLCDNCAAVYNPEQTNIDNDFVGDICDNCLYVYNPDQEDFDGDGIGFWCDPCLNDPLNDIDGDGICSSVDNCPYENPNGLDADNDGCIDTPETFTEVIIELYGEDNTLLNLISGWGFSKCKNFNGFCNVINNNPHYSDNSEFLKEYGENICTLECPEKDVQKNSKK
ncbi:hypothetical protein A3K73_03655 [Candidatus Pacearchaeota archaeon RBG_13_36_9]|nr:MAG: hypothetical protein A3K73_03655 [Candidatus Pacearchaeota archaeon RBG_13_36_9]